MRGAVHQVSISKGGLPKLAVPGAYLSPMGLQGDVQRNTKIHGGPDKAVLLISLEDIELLQRDGFPISPGALGENLTTLGIDFRQLAPGLQFRVGGAVIELTRPRQPCRNLDPYNQGKPGAIQARLCELHALGGFYSRVVQPGFVRAGDPVELLAAVA